MDANTTVRASSNFRHFAAALKKRGEYATAAYIVGLAHGLGDTRMSALQCWTQCRERKYLLAMLNFLEDTSDTIPPALIEAGSLLAAEAPIANVLRVCPDPWAAIEEGEEVEVRLTRAEVTEMRRVIANAQPAPVSTLGSVYHKLGEAK